MKTGNLLLALLLAGICLSCQKEFDPTGEREESYAAYCILNLRDSVQYVRISRVFLTTGNPAMYFQDPDSVNIDPGLMEVYLLPLRDGIPDGDRVIFSPTGEFPKEAGLFSSENYHVFKSATLLRGDRSYRLVIRNRKTGFEMKAEIALLGRRTLEDSFREQRYYNINQYQPEDIDYDGPLYSSQFEKRVERLLYYEYRGEEKKMKYIDWRSPYMKFSPEPAGDTVQFSDELLKYYAANIPVDPGVRRVAVGMDKMLILNDEFLTRYLFYFQQSSSGLYVPDLTDFDRGTGIMASRYNYTFFAMRLNDNTLDSLAFGRYTRGLGFVGPDAGGTLMKN